MPHLCTQHFSPHELVAVPAAGLLRPSCQLKAMAESSSASAAVASPATAQSVWGTMIDVVGADDEGGRQQQLKMLRGQPELILTCFDGGDYSRAGAAAAAAPRIQIASDLHLEFIRVGCGAECDFDEIIRPNAPVLALLGDIGIPTHEMYREFLLYQAERFQAVLVLSGNHEFYDVNDRPDPPPKPGESYSAAMAEAARTRCSTDDMEAEIRGICGEHPALHYVDNTVVRLGSCSDAPALLCTPLWSHVPLDAMSAVHRSLNDYQMCFVLDDVALDEQQAGAVGVSGSGGSKRSKTGAPIRKLTPADTSAWHALAVGWLQMELTRLRSAGVTAMGVLSHHTPSMHGTSHPRFEGANTNPVNHAFSSNLCGLYRSWPELVLWCYGHTHFNADRVDGHTRLVSVRSDPLCDASRRADGTDIGMTILRASRSCVHAMTLLRSHPTEPARLCARGRPRLLRGQDRHARCRPRRGRGRAGGEGRLDGSRARLEEHAEPGTNAEPARGFLSFLQNRVMGG